MRVPTRCGASRSAPLAGAGLAYIPRVEKERDDQSVAQFHLKRLGIPTYDTFFEEFEDAVGEVVELNNVLNDALLELHVACTAAAAPDPNHSLLLEVWTDGVRSTPQLLVDVAYADGSGRPSPWEVRHLLVSRPAVAEADRELSEALQDLVSLVRTHAAAGLLVRLTCQNADRRLPRLAAAAPPGAGHAQHLQVQRIQKQAARVNHALAVLRKVAPGLRVRVDVVPSPAPGARTFAWRLVTREQERPQDGVPLLTGRRATATPLQVAAAHGAAAISDAAATVAQQAAALAAAAAAVPTIELQTRAQRRIVAVTPRSDAAAAAAAADAALPPTPHSPAAGNFAALASGFVSVARSVGSITYAAAHAVIPAAMSHRFNDASPLARSSIGGAPPSPASGAGAGASFFAAGTSGRRPSSSGGAVPVASPVGGPAAGGSPSVHGVSAAVQSEEAAAALRRAVGGANHALFRLAKCAAAGGGGTGGVSCVGSGGVESTAAAATAATTPRRVEPLTAAAVRGVKLVLEATVRTSRQAASDATGGSEAAAVAAAAAAAAKAPPSRASSSRSFSSAFGSKKVRDAPPATTLRPAPLLLSPAAAAMPVCELVDVDARVVVMSESGSAAGWPGAISGGGGGFGRTWNGMGGSLSGVPGSVVGCGTGAGGGVEALGSGRDWSWDWGITPRVEGVAFPDCLPPHHRAVYDALEAAVAAGRAAWSGLPALSSDVSGLVSEAEMLFSENDHLVKKAAGDMMAAGRVRAALDRNANTIIACPALLGQLQAAVIRLVAALHRGSHSMRLMADGLEPLDPDAAATSASGVDVAPLTPLERGSAFTGPGSPLVGAARNGAGSPLGMGGAGGLKKSMGGGKGSGAAAAAVVGKGRFAAAGIGSTASGSPRSGAWSAAGEELQAAATAAATANAATVAARTAAAIAAAVADGEADAVAAAAGLPLNGVVATRSVSASTNGISIDDGSQAEASSAPVGAASTVGVLPALSPARKRSGAASVTVVLPGGGSGGPGHSRPSKSLLAGRGLPPALSPLGPLGGAAGTRDGSTNKNGASPLGSGLSRKKLPPLPPGRVVSGDGGDEESPRIAAASGGTGDEDATGGVGVADKRVSDSVAASSRRGSGSGAAAPVPAAAGISDSGGVLGR
ncbi:hypothetical protein CHLRE_16g669050v5 [Chlamydomonas reinhardtii]|uniref:Uncharacterized protein n=1 Tax=Chlamydomonas reinhardtii TaxID=3055 RepID=A0A2K3CUC4_CHLRE|nr:uncharacterized protein CHLRE_16g669050v5 [Chlamydomonas reinhardtii]PNW71888.1 hypothetical protein CHLRE_16g669050v5 [Chlamydomonas reinhardtii]